MVLLLMQDVDDRSEMDRMRPVVERLQWGVAQQLLQQGLDIVLENGFWTRSERLEYCRAAKNSGFRVALHFLDVPRTELLRRIALRNSETREASLRITTEELDTWLGWLEPPGDDESKAYDEFEVIES